MTNHHSLTNYFKQPTFNSRQACWVDFLSGFIIEIKHLRGKENRVVDAQSRKANCLYEITFNEIQNTFKKKIKEEAMQKLEYQTLWQQTKILENKEQQLRYEINQESLLIYKIRMYVPNIKNI